MSHNRVARNTVRLNNSCPLQGGFVAARRWATLSDFLLILQFQRITQSSDSLKEQVIPLRRTLKNESANRRKVLLL